MTRAPRIRLSDAQQFSVVDSGHEEHHYTCFRLLLLKDLRSVAVKCKKTVWDTAVLFFFRMQRSAVLVSNVFLVGELQRRT